MPLYEYTCNDCCCTFERIHMQFGNPMMPCPKCDKMVEKSKSVVGGTFILKGGGWSPDRYSETPEVTYKDSVSA